VWSTLVSAQRTKVRQHSQPELGRLVAAALRSGAFSEVGGGVSQLSECDGFAKALFGRELVGRVPHLIGSDLVEQLSAKGVHRP